MSDDTTVNPISTFPPLTCDADPGVRDRGCCNAARSGSRSRLLSQNEKAAAERDIRIIISTSLCVHVYGNTKQRRMIGGQEVYQEVRIATCRHRPQVFDESWTAEFNLFLVIPYRFSSMYQVDVFSSEFLVWKQVS